MHSKGVADLESRYEKLLDRLRRAAVDEYGAERADDAVFRAALEVAARHLAVVAQESLELMGPEPERV
jgi:hypothetical protein